MRRRTHALGRQMATAATPAVLLVRTCDGQRTRKLGRGVCWLSGARGAPCTYQTGVFVQIHASAALLSFREQFSYVSLLGQPRWEGLECARCLHWDLVSLLCHLAFICECVRVCLRSCVLARSLRTRHISRCAVSGAHVVTCDYALCVCVLARVARAAAVCDVCAFEA